MAIIQNDIDTCTLDVSHKNKAALDKCMMFYKECEDGIKEEQTFIDKGIEVEYHTKRKNAHLEYGIKFLDLAKRINLYLLAVEEKDKTISLINNLTEDQSNKLVFYDVRLDCYSKNSLGNEVLGRFSFPFTINGVLGDKNGVDKVNSIK